MKSSEFCYWLQGLFELADPKELNEHQTKLIKQHLNLVFYHEIDPSYSDKPEVQAQMNNIHDGNVIYGPNNGNIEFKPQTPGPGGVDEDGIKYRC